MTARMWEKPRQTINSHDLYCFHSYMWFGKDILLAIDIPMICSALL